MSSAQDFTCVFCNEVFETKEILQEHFRKHGDPNFNNGSKNKVRPQNEQAVNEKADDGESVGCDVCDETFPSISKAITHKHKVHPDHDAKYFCPWCGKLFTMKHLYNKHLQSNHMDVSSADDGTGYHCDCCEVEFYVPSAMVYHNKFFHRQDTELPSIGQSKKVKTYNQETLQIYYCPFCGEEYNNKVNLHKHMGDDHEDENQRPDEVLRCPLCDAVFYHLDAYELHLSFHSTDDVYSDENELAAGVTDFSLESVPPIMEKVEEEPKSSEAEGIDKFLQLIMDESRESGNTDTSDIKIKSKKHKKHKKSKKAAITLDEFLNMNKDVFGDGLDVQGIEEVPTQQVLKKCKGKNVAKPIPASALAKLKKQGITVKSNSGIKTPILKPNKNITVNTAKILPNRIPMKVQEKPSAAATPNELLSKLLNQGNSQIKIVKKSAEENLNKDKIPSQLNHQELTVQSLTQNKLSSNTSSADETKINDYEMGQDTDNIPSENQISEKLIVISGETINKACMEGSNIMPQDSSNTKSGQNIYTKRADTKESNSEHPSESKLEIESPDRLQNVNQTESLAHTSDKDDSFETNNDFESKGSDDEHIPDNSEMEPNMESNGDFQEENTNKNSSNKTLDALKHLSGLITIKPTQNTESKGNAFEMGPISSEINAHDTSESMPSNVTKILGKHIPNVTVKKPNSPQINSATSTKPIDAIKQFNNQLSIKTYSSGSPASKVSEESEDNESDNDFHDDIPNSNIPKEDDHATFKTPIATVKQSNATIKASEMTKSVHVKSPVKDIKEEDDAKKAFNMDILKRLTNVTAKPVIKATNNASVARSSVQNLNYSKPMPKVEKNKVIDQDIEIFNIDDSDSDQEAPNEDTPLKTPVNVPKINETKTSVDVLKNISKNITIKPPNQSNVRNVLNVKKEIHSESSRQSIERNIQSPGSTENKFNIQKKQANINLNSTLKKLGNNISIKSQYSSPDPHRFQMQPDDDMDDHFDMNEYDDESDSETLGQVKISEVHDDEDLPSDADMEYNENVVVQSPQASNSENEEEHHSNHSGEANEDFESQIKMNTLTKEKAAPNSCIDNFKRNKELTIKSLNEKNANFPQAGSPTNKKEDVTHMTKSLAKNMAVKQFRESERQEDSETKKVSQSAASSSQKVTNQVNTVKTVKTFQSETIIEEITTTVTKTIRTVNQSSKQVAQKANASTYRPRLASPNQQGRPLQGMTVRNAQTVGTKIRSAGPAPRPAMAAPSRAAGQMVAVRPQNQLVPRQGVYRPSMPGPSNVRKMSAQSSVQKPAIGKPLKISPLAMNQSAKRPTDDMSGHFSCFKKPKDSMISSMDAFDDDFGDDASVNYATATSSRSDFSATATKVVKGKSVVTATQARSEQHSEQHITKLNNMSGLKVVRTSAKQASQIETRTDNMGAAKRTTLDAIEKLQKQGLLIKKPRIETPEEIEQYNSESEHEFDDE